MTDPTLPPPPSAGGPAWNPATPTLPPLNGPAKPSPGGGGVNSAVPRRRRRWVWPVAAAVCLLAGIGLGSSGGGTISAVKYDGVVSERDTLAGKVDDAQAAAAAAEAKLTDQQSALDARAAELDSRQADLEAREAAVTATEQAVAATQIGIGTWTVGVDIEPGTYRTAEAVTSTCYWGIYRSGTNGDDIIQNDIVQGGFPTVTLKEGQDFENGCGLFVKQ